jgi:hypothetical protein
MLLGGWGRAIEVVSCGALWVVVVVVGGEEVARSGLGNV